MAKKKEESSTPTDPPALLNYDEDTSEEWSGADLLNYWNAETLKHRGLNARLWTAKDRGIAKRLVQEFSKEDLEKMIFYWIKCRIKGWDSFSLFYKERKNVNHAVQDPYEKDYGWD